MAKKRRNNKTKQKQAVHHADLDKILSIITEYAKMLGFPVPPIDKMEKMMKSVSQDVQLMFGHHKSKKQIQGGDILILMLKLGLITLVAIPIIRKLMSMDHGEKEKNVKSKIEKESMVD